MKETLTTLIEEMNQSEEIKEEQITKLLSCFEDADTKSETQLIMETEKAVAEILTNERLKMLDRRFISSRMKELLTIAGNVKSYENLGAYQIEREKEESVRCVLQVIRMELDDGTEIYVANAREGRG
ncbi:hypothetical protein VSQ48_21785 [Candidatus Ventrimonas sp. KK005]